MMNHKMALQTGVREIRMIEQDNKWFGSMAFIIALLCYAIFSAPFPAQPGIAEATIGSLLVLFVTIPTGLIVMTGGFTLYQRYRTVPMWLHLGFFMLLWWGLFNGGVIHSWDVTDIVRDIIPCVYLFVPLMLLPAMNRTKYNWLKIFPWVIAFMGVILSMRFYNVANMSPLDVGKMYFFDNYLYLPYDPSVIFAGIFLPLMAIHTWKSSKLYSWVFSLFMLVGGFLALGSLMAVAQRAPLALAALSFSIYFLIISRRSLKRMLLLVIVLLGVGVLAQQQIESSYQLLIDKQESFGANGKTDELAAVIKETSQSSFSLMFGMGWGGLFHDPAVEFVEVSYTHSAMTFFLLKGGIFGVVIFLAYVLWISRNLLRSLSIKTLPIVLSSFMPVIIGLFFQVSYKTLSYGMILTLMCLLYKQQVEKKAVGTTEKLMKHG
ncbi:hypothetical protein [Paenibacillus pini]|uniref:Uncharacterized protein n=1 Tax=Paenibacillus pini JCM 16418 TaxID=1236976 RepID=W7Z134_9BACL|nr:hypothetical protein [Paenibacillus pini]GAF08079.1 hypothetical protein JCM16418_2117 [Paenibacillus pini JCM 16418]